MALWRAAKLSPNMVEACCGSLEGRIAVSERGRSCCGSLESRAAVSPNLVDAWCGSLGANLSFSAQQVLSTFPAGMILEGSSEAVWTLL